VVLGKWGGVGGCGLSLVSREREACTYRVLHGVLVWYWRSLAKKK
jgi:hypothetical protein